MTRSRFTPRILPVACIVGALIAVGAPAAQAQEVPPTNDQCEQAQRDVESLRPALAKAQSQVAAKEGRVKQIKRAIQRTSSKKKKRQLRRKLAGARKSLAGAEADAEETQARLTAARERLGQC